MELLCNNTFEMEVLDIINDYDDEPLVHTGIDKNNWFFRNRIYLRLFFNFVCCITILFISCFLFYFLWQALYLVHNVRNFIERNQPNITETFEHTNIAITQFQQMVNQTCCSFGYECCRNGRY